jgi:hypothetical protein
MRHRASAAGPKCTGAHKRQRRARSTSLRLSAKRAASPRLARVVRLEPQNAARVTAQPFRFSARSALLRLACLHEQHCRLLEGVVRGSAWLHCHDRSLQPLPKLVRTAKEHGVRFRRGACAHGRIRTAARPCARQHLRNRPTRKTERVSPSSSSSAPGKRRSNVRCAASSSFLSSRKNAEDARRPRSASQRRGGSKLRAISL